MNKYLIALSVGGLMEQPEITYEDFQVIEATTQYEAIKKYNELNKCSYFYGTCMAENINGDINVLNRYATYKDVEMLK